MTHSCGSGIHCWMNRNHLTAGDHNAATKLPWIHFYQFLTQTRVHKENWSNCSFVLIHTSLITFAFHMKISLTDITCLSNNLKVQTKTKLQSVSLVCNRSLVAKKKGFLTENITSDLLHQVKKTNKFSNFSSVFTFLVNNTPFCNITFVCICNCTYLYPSNIYLSMTHTQKFATTTISETRLTHFDWQCSTCVTITLLKLNTLESES